ncbi:ATP-binding cassette domain-containing protein [Nocardia wallacei]|uniref:ATP-binding cassette domain-containing protein n=1 Tax=Nocardia wallacei TaxID=480035 RepID=UPI0024546D14|nr:ATP-binding cassette domain-containing protein [Nocardia wallacei]
MERLGITKLARRRLTTLSGGQQQRTLLAQALAQESDLLLLDEPSAGLDAEAREKISQIVREICTDGVTVVQATHEPGDALHADHCLLLHNGRLVTTGEPRTVSDEHTGIYRQRRFA